MHRYRRVHSLTILWLSSVSCFSDFLHPVALKDIEVSLGHFKESELYPEYAIIASEIASTVPQSRIFYHYIRRVEKYTFSIFSNSAAARWGVLESFINEFLPEMDVHRESKIGSQDNSIIYRKRGRCLEFVRCSQLKTARSTWRRDPYPFTLSIKYYNQPARYLKQVETYFRMLRLPIQIHGRISHWWLAKRWWVAE
jgi:hypothetical protein